MKLSPTEKQNSISRDLDTKSINEILAIINFEDSKVAKAVKEVIPEIEKIVNFAVETIKNGNKILYIGAGTSGRLGVLDASECVPTFSVPDNYFKGIIAGGNKALTKSIENSEDEIKNVDKDLKKGRIAKDDLIIGISSSGSTPYVLHAMKLSKKKGCKTVLIVCNKLFKSNIEIDLIVSVDVGEEVLTGSTRMKSGTATKMILNMISTTTMIKIGKVYDNLMVDLKVVNKKLLERGLRIINLITGLEKNKSKKILIKANNEVKTAIVMHNNNLDYNSAKKYLIENGGFLREVLKAKIKK